MCEKEISLEQETKLVKKIVTYLLPSPCCAPMHIGQNLSEVVLLDLVSKQNELESVRKQK